MCVDDNTDRWGRVMKIDGDYDGDFYLFCLRYNRRGR